MTARPRVRASVTDLTGLTHHTDAGSQDASLTSTERLAALGIQPSLETVGVAYDNALAEFMIGPFKTELISHRGPWRRLDNVEIATLEEVDPVNSCRLHAELSGTPSADDEQPLRSAPRVDELETRDRSSTEAGRSTA